MSSAFFSKHEAQDGGYYPQYYLMTDRTPSAILQKVELDRTEYLTFRTRIVKDDDGNIVSSHYGKITEKLDYGSNRKNPEGATVSFTYYFNPTPNDRNLEFDTGKNLFDNDWRTHVSEP